MKSQSVTRSAILGSLLENKRNVFQSMNLVPDVFCLLIVLMAQVISGSSGESLQNMAVSEGEEVTLRCQANSERVTWTATLGSSIVLIYDGYSVNPSVSGYEIGNTGSGQFELIFNASSQAANLFICQAVGVRPLKQSAEVIVIESEPKCNQAYSSGGSDVTLTCQVGYSGNWRPKLEWRIDDEPMNSTDLPNRSDQPEGKVLSVAFDYFYNEDHTFRCHASFSMDMYNGEATVTNVPQYNSFCNVTVPRGIMDTTNMPTDMPESESNHSLKIVVPILVVFGIGIGFLLLFLTRKKWQTYFFQKRDTLNYKEEKKKINGDRNPDSTENETKSVNA